MSSLTLPARTNRRISMLRLPLLAAAVCALPTVALGADPKDWPSYNGGAAGWRFNAGETTLGPANVDKLEEKWRFPARDSDLKIGSVHATPVVVDGEVYFGTVTQPTFYKLAPDGTLRWKYLLPVRVAGGKLDIDRTGKDAKGPKEVDEAVGVFSSALVTGDAVYFADMGGYFYALDRKTGKEKWKIDARGKDFPDAHPLNASF